MSRITGNKKSQIPSTIEWIPAFLIIVVVIAMFVSFSLFAAMTKKSSAIEMKAEGEKLLLTEQSINFLNTPVENEGKQIRINELLLSLDLEKVIDEKWFGKVDRDSEEFKKFDRNMKIFRENANEIFSKIYPQWNENSRVWQVFIHKKTDLKFEGKDSGIYRYTGTGNSRACLEGDKNENRIAYAEIELTENTILFFCLNIVKLEELKDKALEREAEGK